jgi:hypothetical protein
MGLEVNYIESKKKYDAIQAGLSRPSKMLLTVNDQLR